MGPRDRPPVLLRAQGLHVPENRSHHLWVGTDFLSLKASHHHHQATVGTMSYSVQICPHDAKLCSLSVSEQIMTSGADGGRGQVRQPDHSPHGAATGNMNDGSRTGLPCEDMGTDDEATDVPEDVPRCVKADPQAVGRRSARSRT